MCSYLSLSLSLSLACFSSNVLSCVRGIACVLVLALLASKASKASSKLAVKLVKMTNIVVNQTKVIKVGTWREETHIYIYRERAYTYIYICRERQPII